MPQHKLQCEKNELTWRGAVRQLTSDLWVPLVPDVLVGGGARDGEADDEDVGLRVRQRPESVVLLLTRGVPQVQTDDPAVHGHLNAPRTHSQAFL